MTCAQHCRPVTSQPSSSFSWSFERESRLLPACRNKGSGFCSRGQRAAPQVHVIGFLENNLAHLPISSHSSNTENMRARPPPPQPRCGPVVAEPRACSRAPPQTGVRPQPPACLPSCRLLPHLLCGAQLPRRRVDTSSFPVAPASLLPQQLCASSLGDHPMSASRDAPCCPAEGGFLSHQALPAVPGAHAAAQSPSACWSPAQVIELLVFPVSASCVGEGLPHPSPCACAPSVPRSCVYDTEQFGHQHSSCSPHRLPCVQARKAGFYYQIQEPGPTDHEKRFPQGYVSPCFLSLPWSLS